MSVDGKRAAGERLLVFRVGAERFGVPLTDVDEVVDAPAIQPLPDAPRIVLGIAPIRGAFVLVYDPRPLLHLLPSPSASGRTPGAALLFTSENKRIALAVDDVFDALSVGEDEMRPPPPVGVSDAFVIGVIRRGSDLIAVLDCRALLNAATAVNLEAATANVEAGDRKHS